MINIQLRKKESEAYGSWSYDILSMMWINIEILTKLLLFVNQMVIAYNFQNYLYSSVVFMIVFKFLWYSKKN